MLNNLLLGQTAEEKLYVEDVFSSYLYRGTGGDSSVTNTITNDIDLAGKGGLVWIKTREAAISHALYDTARGVKKILGTDSTAAEAVQGSVYGLTSFNSNGFTLTGNWASRENADTPYASWTFRKAPKFFDVLTYVGNGSASRAITHSLGIVPGMIVIKRTTSASDWFVYHRGHSLPRQYYATLNGTGAFTNASPLIWANTNPTTSQFFVGDPLTNTSGETYVAYLFAHDTTADGIVQCGSFTTNASGIATVNLGWEPQFLLYKRTDNSIGGDWRLFDNMRGLTVSYAQRLLANTSAAETGPSTDATLNARGFGVNASGSATYIYLAIRRGPMRVPTDATKVFAPVIWTGNNTAGRNIETGFTLDLFFGQPRTQPGAVQTNTFYDRLRGFSSTAAGNSVYLRPLNTDAEGSVANYIYLPTMNGFSFGSVASGSNQYNNSSFTMVSWNFKRAPGFFDIVCYTGNSTAAIGSQSVSHNLGVAPELIIIKARTKSDGVWFAGTNFRSTQQSIGYFNTGGVFQPNYPYAAWFAGPPTTTTFIPINQSGSPYYQNANENGVTYVAYLFASCPGVSKVGSYTGNGSSLNIDCGFTNGARFVLIKRTDSTGDWYVWDTARGIVAANDPHLSLNSIANEVTTNDTIDPLSTGFTVNQVAATNVNVNAATYIYLAIA